MDKMSFPDGTHTSLYSPKVCTHGSIGVTTSSQDLLSEANVKKAHTIVIYNPTDTVVWVENDGGDAASGTGHPIAPASGNNYGCLVLSRLTATLAPKKLTVIHGGTGTKTLQYTVYSHSALT